MYSTSVVCSIAIPILRRQDEPLLIVQENRAGKFIRLILGTCI